MDVRSVLSGFLRAFLENRGRPNATSTSEAESFWTNAFDHGGIATWMSEEICRFHINENVSGSPHEWPMEWFNRVYAAEPFGLGLSLGCGDGALERDVRKKEVCQAVVGIDISEGAIQIAAQEAASEGLTGISYERGDFNTFVLPPNRYDIVFFHQAMHHVAELEHCVSQISTTLKPGGILYLDEYVGPSRNEWTDEHLVQANEIFSGLPRNILPHSISKVPYPIEEDDPSEAVRSSEILPLVSDAFEIIDQRDYGGNLLAILHPLIKWNKLDKAEAEHHLLHLIEEERRLLRTAPSYYTVVIAKNPN